MPVSKFILPLSVVDGDLAVLARIGAIFAPHEADPAAMSIVLEPGHIRVGASLIEIGKQLVTGIVAPVTNARIDRVVLNNTTGVASVVKGTESASPTVPALTVGQIPVAQILLVPGQSKITNDAITDERDLNGSTLAQGALLNVQRFSANGTYTPTPGTTSVIVEALGGGAGGGGAAATGAGQMSVGGGGGAGAYACGRFTSGFSGVAVTVGAAIPVGAAGSPGANGNTTSFGNLVVAPGGFGGNAGEAVNVPTITFGGNASLVPTGDNIAGGPGQGGFTGIAVSTTSAAGGRGGATLYAAGSSGSANGNSGSGSATWPGGAGGGGGSNLPNMPARSGGPGEPGLVIVYEYA